MCLNFKWEVYIVGDEDPQFMPLLETPKVQRYMMTCCNYLISVPLVVKRGSEWIRPFGEKVNKEPHIVIFVAFIF